MMTKAQAAQIGRDIGMTIRWDSDWQEFAVYPRNTSKEHPSAYFTTCVDDAVTTARVMVENGILEEA